MAFLDAAGASTSGYRMAGVHTVLKRCGFERPQRGSQRARWRAVLSTLAILSGPFMCWALYSFGSRRSSGEVHHQQDHAAFSFSDHGVSCAGGQVLCSTVA